MRSGKNYSLPDLQAFIEQCKVKNLVLVFNSESTFPELLDLPQMANSSGTLVEVRKVKGEMHFLNILII